VTATAAVATPANDDRHLGAQAVVPAVGQIVYRGLLSLVRTPSTVIPIVAMPIFFTLAFSGAFSALVNLPGFPTDNILNWMVPFAVLQGASFAGLAAGFITGRDLENGFYDRLLLSPAPRVSLIIGPLVYSGMRAFLPLLTVVPAGLLGGARMIGGAAGYLVLTVGAVGTAICAALWGLGVVYRLRSQRAGALVQAGIFATLFLSIGQVPLSVMTGWLHTVATLNPFTRVLTMARQGFLGPVTWADTWPGLLALTWVGLALGWFALRGFKRLTP